MDITATDFRNKSTAREAGIKGVEKGSKLHDLINKLNTSTTYSTGDPKGSIMAYDVICEHDNGYLCEHRLKFLIDYVKENFVEADPK